MMKNQRTLATVAEQGGGRPPYEQCLFRLRSLELVKGGREYQLAQQLTISYSMIILKNGEGMLTLDKSRYQLKPGSVYVCAPDRTFGVEATSADGVELLLLHFDVYWESKGNQKLLQEVEPVQLFDGQNEIPIQPTAQLTTLSHAISSAWNSEEELERFHSQLLFQELIYVLLKSKRQLSAGSGTVLERVVQYMEEHAHENVTIEQLARLADLSSNYFADLFKKTYGKSVMDFITQIRISRAKELMIRSDLRLREIAHQVGYNDEFYFSRKFKKEVGVSPSVYIKSRSRKIAAYGAPVIGQLVALRVMPYAAPLHPKWTGYYFRTYGHDIPIHLSAYRQNNDWELNMQTLVETRPDLIICKDDLAPEQQAMLKEIAPVFHVPTSGKNWREQFLATADFLGESSEAQQWLSTYDQLVHKTRASLQRKLGEERVLVVRLLKQDLHVYCNQTMADVLYGDLQLRSPFHSEELTYNVKTNLSRLAQLNPDRILMMVCHETETLAQWKLLQSSPEWQSLQAVRTRRVHLIPSDSWREYSPVAHDRVVHEVESIFSVDRPC